MIVYGGGACLTGVIMSGDDNEEDMSCVLEVFGLHV